MKSFDSRESKSFSYFTSGLISLGLHLTVAGILFVFARFTPETPPPPMTVMMLSEPPSAVPPSPMPPAPMPPAPEPPAPEPPVPEPPAPEPPKPEPPKPEPPAPEPPAPEPPKPEPPKPPKPAPAIVKEPVKEVVKPKPVPSVAERFKNAEVKTSRNPAPPKPVSRPVSKQSDIRSRLIQGVLQQSVTSSSAYQSTANLTSEQRVIAAVAVDYANQVANPFITPIWQEFGPGKGELGNQLPNPVKVEFTVLEEGKIVGARITQRSNSEAMNQAVERLLVRLRQERLPSLPSVGIKYKSLSIVIFLKTSS